MKKLSRSTHMLLAALFALLSFQFLQWTGADVSPVSSPHAETPATPPLTGITGPELMQRVSQSKKPSLVFIYASWCPYCIKQKPAIDAITQSYVDQLQVLPIAIDQDVDKLARYIKNSPFRATSYRVPQEAFVPFRIELEKIGSNFVGSIPYSAVIAPDGTLLEEFSGYVDQSILEARLNQLTQETETSGSE